MGDYGLYVHRHEGLTFFQDYPTRKEAAWALVAYIRAAKAQGFAVRRRVFTTRLHKDDVKLTVWVDRIDRGMA